MTPFESVSPARRVVLRIALALAGIAIFLSVGSNVLLLGLRMMAASTGTSW